MHQAGVPCLEVFVAKGQDGQLRQQASVLRAATPPADEAQPSSKIGEAFAAGVGLPELPMGLRISRLGRGLVLWQPPSSIIEALAASVRTGLSCPQSTEVQAVCG